MTYVRVLWPLVFGAALAACSGNLGGGQSTLPGAPQGTTNGASIQQVTPPTPTASPVSASNVATVGNTAGAQPLPAVMGWGGSITFPEPSAAPTPSPNAKSSPAAATAPLSSAVSVGVTAAVVEPSDAPHFSPRGSGKHADPAALKGLFYISLLSTADVTLGEYPKIAVDVPRATAAKYRDATYGLALYDPESKEKAYRLAVADRDLTSPPPGSSPATPAPTPTLTPMPSSSAGPFGMPNGTITPPPVGLGLDVGAALPPERIAFLGTAASLTLKANTPVVFAFYVVPPQPSPKPSATGTSAAASPSPPASPAPGTSSSPSTAPSSAPTPAPARS
jgi:hypothetical protein